MKNNVSVYLDGKTVQYLLDRFKDGGAVGLQGIKVKAFLPPESPKCLKNPDGSVGVCYREKDCDCFSPQPWEREFEEKFERQDGESIFRFYRLDFPGDDSRGIKSFIKNLLFSTREEAYNEGQQSAIETNKWNIELVEERERARILEALPKKKENKFTSDLDKNTYETIYHTGFSDCLSEVIKVIKGE